MTETRDPIELAEALRSLAWTAENAPAPHLPQSARSLLNAAADALTPPEVDVTFTVADIKDTPTLLRTLAALQRRLLPVERARLQFVAEAMEMARRDSPAAARIRAMRETVSGPTVVTPEGDVIEGVGESLVDASDPIGDALKDIGENGPFYSTDVQARKDVWDAGARFLGEAMHLFERLARSSEASAEANLRMVEMAAAPAAGAAPSPVEPVDALYVVFDHGEAGDPSPVFVEVEDTAKRGLAPEQYGGEWMAPDERGYTALRIPLGARIDRAPPAEPTPEPVALDYKDRARAELAELDGRRAKLAAFIVGEDTGFAALPLREKALLRDQHDAMTGYRIALSERIALWTRVDPETGHAPTTEPLQ